MKIWKVLNLYAGIGGNRKLWEDVEVTAVEINPSVAKIYQDFYPDDKVVVADAHQYLLNHFDNGYDFIWSSPPCQTHSNVNNFLNAQGCRRYPDMELYQEILYLNCFCKVKWVVENVKSYYTPLLKPFEVDRHYFWSNFIIPHTEFKPKYMTVTNCRESTRRRKQEHIELLKKYHGLDVDHLQGLKNCVNPKLGMYVIDCARKRIQTKLVN